MHGPARVINRPPNIGLYLGVTVNVPKKYNRTISQLNHIFKTIYFYYLYDA